MHLADLSFLNLPFARYYLFALLMAAPVTRIFMRAGFKPYWIFLLAVPDVGLILCTVLLAARKWPQEKGA